MFIYALTYGLGSLDYMDYMDIIVNWKQWDHSRHGQLLGTCYNNKTIYGRDSMIFISTILYNKLTQLIPKEVEPQHIQTHSIFSLHNLTQATLDITHCHLSRTTYLVHRNSRPNPKKNLNETKLTNN